MFSKRIKTIASLIKKDEIVLDVGTDHAYLPIYLFNENVTKNIYASDISSKVLKIANFNLVKHNLEENIKLILSDGLKDININYTTLVITGMGYNTIKKILRSGKLPKTIIIQSNSDHKYLRKYMNRKGYKIKKEVTLLENKKYYVIISYTKGLELLPNKYILFGKSYNKDYYNYLIDKYNNLISKVPLKKQILFKKYIKYLNILLKKC